MIGGYPTTQKSTDKHALHTPHTWQQTMHDMTAVLSQYALGVDGIGRTQWIG